MATGAVIRYKKNDIRLTSINFITSAVAYVFVVNELISGKNIFSYKTNDVFGGMVFLLAAEVGFCVGLLFLAIYQRHYNKRLTEAGISVNRWYFSERALNYLSVAALILIGLGLFILPFIEIQKGAATGGFFFQNHRLIDEPNLFWQMIYFHFTMCAVPVIGGMWLLVFPPKKQIFNQLIPNAKIS